MVSLSSSSSRKFLPASFIGSVGRWDLFLIASMISLVIFGLLALYSLDGGLVSAGSKALKQAGWLLIALFGFVGFSLVNYEQLRKATKLLFLFSIFILGLVLLIGKTTNGTTGWIKFGGFGFQPVELVKIILIVVLARFLSDSKRQNPLWLIGGSFILAAVPFGLVLLQPDFGSGILFLAVWGGLLIVRGISWRWLFLIILIGVLAVVLGWSHLSPYQKDRVQTFLQMKSDANKTAAYQITQSKVAVGSGKIFGRGLGSGSQSQLHFLPEASTDFVFAAIAEEFGFLGIGLFFAAFLFLCYRLYAIIKASRDDFAFLAVSGFFILLATEFIINSAMNIGLFPIMGIPLPLVSYGGSSLVSTFIGLGIAHGIHRQRKSLSFAN